MADGWMDYLPPVMLHDHDTDFAMTAPCNVDVALKS